MKNFFAVSLSLQCLWYLVMILLMLLLLGKGNEHLSPLMRWITWIVKMYCKVLQFSPTIQSSLLLFMEYVDLGKWVAAIEWCFHSGQDLQLLVFFNCTAVLWQYLANCICLVTGKNLAQVCYEEYSRLTCTLLGIVVALSIIASDLTKILGVAHGFSVLFELDLLSCTFLASVVAVMLPIAFSLSGSSKFKVLCHSMSIVTSVFYMLGVFFSLLGASFVTHNAYSTLNLKNACTTMALLGAQIMPHNFYIHSSSEQHTSRLNDSMGAVIQTHLLTIISVFTSIFLVNSVLMNSAASVFNNYGFPIPSLQDAFLLLDQIFMSSSTPFPFWLIFFFSSIVTAINLNRMGKIITHDFFHVNLPCWVPQIIVKVFAVTLVFYCTKGAGLEGIYHLLIFSQVISAILLPPSMLPIYQVSSSRLIMGAFKISSLVEFLCMVSFMGVFTTNSIFILELLCGNSGWTIDLRGNIESDFTLLYFFLILLSLASLCFTIYLFFRSLRSSEKKEQIKHSEPRGVTDSLKVLFNKSQKHERGIFLNNSSYHQCDCYFLESKTSVISEQHNDTCELNQTSCPIDSVVREVFAGGLTNGSREIVDVNMIPGEIPVHNHLVRSSEPVDPSGSVMSVKSPLDHPVSVNDVNGNETNFGMARGAKRQFAAILNEFWGLLFDYHGNLTDEAKNIKATILLDLGFESCLTSIDETAGQTPASQKCQVDDAQIHPTFATVSGCHKNSRTTHSSPTARSQDWRLTNYGGFHAQTSSRSLDPPIHGSKTGRVSWTFADYEDGISKPIHAILGYDGFWSNKHINNSRRMTSGDKSIYSPSVTLTWGGKVIHSTSGVPKKFLAYEESECLVLQSLQFCVRKLLRIDNSGWLFCQSGGYDEKLIDKLAKTERLLHKDCPCDFDEGLIIFLPNVLNCGEGCIWKASLVVSFGVWCVHRILELLLVEGRPELWGKYTYVLNRLQGILYPAFCKHREAPSFCKCLQSSYYSNGVSSTAALTSRTFILDLIKGAEMSISKRKGRGGTGAGDIAFPKGKENVSSVLKRYRRRLSKLST